MFNFLRRNRQPDSRTYEQKPLAEASLPDLLSRSRQHTEKARQAAKRARRSGR